MSDTNIRVGKIGDVNANNNKGVINLLAVGQDIQNAIAEMSVSPTGKQANAKKLIEQLHQEIQNNADLSDKQKEKALKQVKELVEVMKTNTQSEPSLQERAENVVTLIKGIVAGASNTASIFKVISEISSLLGLA